MSLESEFLEFEKSIYLMIKDTNWQEGAPTRRLDA